MADAYETFVRTLADLREGQRSVLVLRDLTPGPRKYFATHALAAAARSPGSGGDWRPLTVRSAVGNVLPGPWYVHVIRVLPSRIPGTPYTNAYEAMDRAWGHLAHEEPNNRPRP